MTRAAHDQKPASGRWSYEARFNSGIMLALIAMNGAGAKAEDLPEVIDIIVKQIVHLWPSVIELTSRNDQIKATGGASGGNV
jgi:hypothetical protein